MIKSKAFKQMTLYTAVEFIVIVYFEVAQHSIISRLLIEAMDHLWYFRHITKCNYC